MSEVLSQSEIDKLLNALSSGEIDVDEYKEKEEKNIVSYDFSRPAKFSKEHLRTLEIIFEHYGRVLYTNLSAYLRKAVQVEVVSAEAIVYSEFSNSLTNPLLLGVIDFAPLNGEILIEISPDIGYAMIDRLLGGNGDSLEKKRDFSEIELIVVDKILKLCVDLLVEPWENVVTLEPKVQRIETNAQFAQIISPNEMVALLTMNCKIGDVEGLIHFCLPFLTLESVMNKLNTKYWYSTRQDNSDVSYEGAIEHMIEKTMLPVKAVLGKSRISVIDFVNLQEGDIIKLDSGIEDELTVYVGNLKKFKALPGSASENYAVRVTSIIREE